MNSRNVVRKTDAISGWDTLDTPDTLFGDLEGNEPDNTKPDNAAVKGIPLARIHPSKQQPRAYFDPEKQQQLVASVKKHGILEPLLVRPLDQGGYELVAGERRYRAAQEVGMETVPIVVRELNDDEALQLALEENLQRDDLNPVEETEGVLKLLSSKLNKPKQYVIGLFVQAGHPERESGKNVFPNSEWKIVEEIFSSIGRLTTDSFRTARLPLLNMPEEVLNAIRQGKIQHTKGREIAKVKDKTQRQKLLKESISKALPLTAIKAQVKSLKSSSEGTKKEEEATLKIQLTQSFNKLKQRKIWENPNPKKKKKLERLKALIEEILADDEANP